MIYSKQGFFLIHIKLCQVIVFSNKNYFDELDYLINKDIFYRNNRND